jgi:PII-like signaling protein
VHLVAVTPLPIVNSSIDEIKDLEEAGRATLLPTMRAARTYAEEHGQPVTTEMLAGPPADMILRVVATRAIDLVVIGQAGESLDAEWRAVAHKAPCPVFVAREVVVEQFTGPQDHRAEQWEIRRDHRQRIEGTGRMMRILVGEYDERNGRPVYELIVERLRELDIAGATVYRGVMGFGAAGHLHAPGHRPWSHDRPMVITAVDTDAAIRRAITGIADLVTSGLVVCSSVEIIKYARAPSAPLASIGSGAQEDTSLA